MLWRILERFKAGYEHVGQDEKTFGALVVFIEATQDAGGNELAQRRASKVDVLPVVEVGLFVQEMGTVDEEAIDYRSVSIARIRIENERWQQSVTN